MKNTLRALSAMLAVLILSGCAAGLDKNATAIDWSKGSVMVMSVEMDNKYRPNYQPTHLGVVVTKKASSDPRERINSGASTPAGTNAFLVTSQIQPGRYSVSRIVGMSNRFPILGGVDFAVDAPFEVAPNSVTYLGRLVTINKERTDKNDQSTGGVIPLIDQAVSGFGGGTLEVVLSDNYDEDIKLLKKEFLAIQNLDVIRSPLQKMTLERTTGSSAAPIQVKSRTPITAAAEVVPQK